MNNRFDIRGDVTAIYIKYQGKEYEALIDTEDLEKVKAVTGKWFGSNGYLSNGLPYVATTAKAEDGKYKTVFLHRLVMGAPKGKYVDHINGNPLDNRKCNLRLVSNVENMHNYDKNGNRGITFDKDINKWIARYRSVYLGAFDTEEEAREKVKQVRGIVWEAEVNGATALAEEFGIDLSKFEVEYKTSGIPNVYWYPYTRKWFVMFRIKGKNRGFGYFDENDIETAKQVAEFVRERLKEDTPVEEIKQEVESRFFNRKEGNMA